MLRLGGVEKPTNFMCRFSWNLVLLISWYPLCLYMDFFTLFYVLVIVKCLCISILQFRVPFWHLCSKGLKEIYKKAVNVFNAHVYRATQYTLAVCRDCIISFRSWSKSKVAKVGSCMGQRRTFKCSLEMYWRRSLNCVNERWRRPWQNYMTFRVAIFFFKDSCDCRQFIPLLQHPIISHAKKTPAF